MIIMEHPENERDGEKKLQLFYIKKVLATFYFGTARKQCVNQSKDESKTTPPH